jgi:hypothetical protein
MKKTAKMSLWLLGLVLFLGSCEDRMSPSGYVTTQERLITEFDGLEVSPAFTVDIRFTSGDEKVEIEADDNLQALILVDKIGSTLRIGIKSGTNISGNATLRAHILTPTPMKYLAASGATHIRLQNPLEAQELHVDLSGASSLEGAVIVTDFRADLEGASSMVMEGNIENLTGNVEGASLIDGFGVECTDLSLYLSGASNASLTVNGTIELDAFGSSILVFRGSPTIRHINLSGSSKLVDGN